MTEEKGVEEEKDVHYQCVSCDRISDSPGECCGQPMAQVGSKKKDGGESQMQLGL
ncbi:MAG: hypothetical protein HY551_06860 [Elusimicrobia bacterium]|nr:hypothetical protein [Elusimicrobiota bacterium]